MRFFRPPTGTLAALPLCLCLLALSACEGDYRAEAVGPATTITVVTDSSLWAGPLGETLRAQLAPQIETLPQPEPLFEIDFVNYDRLTRDRLNQVRQQRNVVFAAPLSDTSGAARFIRQRLDSAVTALVQRGERSLFVQPDLWYRGQIVAYLTAPNADSLSAALQGEAGRQLRYVINRRARERMTVELFDKGRQEEIEQQLLERHDFALNVQHDFIVAQDTLHFVRLRRVLVDTWRDVWVYYIENADPSVLTPAWIHGTRDAIGRAFLRGSLDSSFVQIEYRLPLVTENVNFLGRYGFETRGLWRMAGDAMGGPFLNYTFYDEAQRRIYMLDGMVFAPSYDKREFLRQIESILHTFRSAPEAAGNAAPAAAARTEP